MTIVLVFGLLLWAGAVLVYARSPVASLFHPVTYYLFFYGFVFVLRPLMNAWYGYAFIYRVFQFTPSDADRVTALLAADLGLVAFVGVAMATGTRRLVLKPATPTTRTHRRYAGSFWLMIALCAGPGLYSLYYGLSRQLTGAATMALDASTGVFTNTTTNGYLTDAGNMLIPIVVLVPWFYRFRPVSLLPFLAYTGARLLNGGGRWTFVMAAASLALAFLYERRSRWIDAQTAILGAVVLGLFTAVGANREVFASAIGGEAASAPWSDDRLAPLEDEHYANQEFLEYLVYAIPRRTGTHGWFLDNLQVLTEPVPRALWPGKPIGPPIQLYKLFDYGFPIGMTFSLPGEGWAQAGFIGVAIWCGLFGWLFGRAYQWFAGCAQTEFQMACYVLLLPLSIQFFRDGQVLTLLRFPFFYLIPIGVWWLAADASGRNPKRWTQRVPTVARQR